MWLVEEKDRYLTPNRYHQGYMRQHVLGVEFVVYHFTAGGFEGALRWLTSTESKASAHFIISKAGRTVQLSPLSDRTWHAGGKTSRWRNSRYVNDRSIGIEIENWGRLSTKKEPNGTVKYVTSYDKPFLGGVYTATDGSMWDAYTEAQMAAVELLTQKLVKEFPQLREPDGTGKGPPDGRFIGHQHVDGTRKVDPGPGFNWGRILQAVEKG